MLPDGQDLAVLVQPGFRLAHKWNIDGQVVLLYTRTG